MRDPGMRLRPIHENNSAAPVNKRLHRNILRRLQREKPLQTAAKRRDYCALHARGYFELVCFPGKNVLCGEVLEGFDVQGEEDTGQAKPYLIVEVLRVGDSKLGDRRED